MSTTRVRKVSKKKDQTHLIILAIGLALCAFSLALTFSTIPSLVSAQGFHHHETEHDNQILAQLCSNGVDDDDDGYIDLLDSDCAEFIPVCSSEEHANETLNCVPNEPEDPVCVAPQQLVDHVCTDPQPPEDPTCESPQVLVNHECVVPEPEDPTCSEAQHLDNHACVDNATSTPEQTSGTGSTNANNQSNNPECSDGIDNDNDGPTDYPNDKSCSDSSDNTEGSDAGAFFGGSNNSGGGGGGNGTLGAGLVLGASTDLPNGCSALLTPGSYMKMGWKNDPEKIKTLQEFLNKELSLALALDGVFGQSTFNAVAAFQKKYGDEVLLPWVKFGLKNKDTPTGFVYKTTLRKINLLNCASLNIPMPQLP